MRRAARLQTMRIATYLHQGQRCVGLVDTQARTVTPLALTEAEAAQLHGPVGLNLGALTPPEIAMSIVAEMTAMQRGVDLGQSLSSWEGSKTLCGLA